MSAEWFVAGALVAIYLVGVVLIRGALTGVGPWWKAFVIILWPIFIIPLIIAFRKK